LRDYRNSEPCSPRGKYHESPEAMES
jgi:hypothetical protein